MLFFSRYPSHNMYPPFLGTRVTRHVQHFQVCYLILLYFFDQTLLCIATLSNSSEQNKSHPRIVFTASIHGARTCVLIIVINAQCVISRVVRVLRLTSMADSRTERLCILLPVSIRSGCITHMYLIQPLLLSTSFPMK